MPSYTRLGTEPKTDAEIRISLTDRYSGMYVLGTQGMGKSGFLQTIINQDVAAGMAVVVIDPHGDLVDDIIAQLPQASLNKTFVLDLEDESYPFGVSPFADAKFSTEMEKTETIERIIRIFYLLWPEVATQASLPLYLRAATITLLHNPGSTLVDMLDLLTDPEARQRLLKAVTDEWVLRFWKQHDEGGKQAVSEVKPLVRRLNSLFMGKSLARNIVGQRKNSIDFRQAIEERRIILIKLPTTTAYEESQLAAALLISQLQAVVFSYRDVPSERRPGVSIFADEAHVYMTADAEKLLTQGRKFGCRLTLVHQFRGQLPAFLQNATKTARTKVLFRTTAEDAAEMGKLFHTTVTSFTPTTNPVRELLNNTPKDPAVRLFVEGYLRPLKHYRLHGNIKVTHRGDDFRGELFNFGSSFFNGHDRDKPETVEDPTDALNSLLREVMQSGSAYLPIDPIIPKGFANAGVGFMAMTRGLYDDNPALQPDFEWPLHLVHGNRWVKHPDSAREQFWHFLFSLRQLMRYLATNPIGKATESSNSTKVPQWLANLKPRRAFVQMSDGVAVMDTLDAPPSVDRENLQARQHFIREQTRQTYCHPRAEIEGKPTPQPTPLDPETFITESTQGSRWEDA